MSQSYCIQPCYLLTFYVSSDIRHDDDWRNLYIEIVRDGTMGRSSRCQIPTFPSHYMFQGPLTCLELLLDLFFGEASRLPLQHPHPLGHRQTDLIADWNKTSCQVIVVLDQESVHDH